MGVKSLLHLMSIEQAERGWARYVPFLHLVRDFNDKVCAVPFIIPRRDKVIEADKS